MFSAACRQLDFFTGNQGVRDGSKKKLQGFSIVYRLYFFKKLLDEMKKIEGFPLKTVTNIKIMNMEMKTSKVVTSIEKGSISASVFDIPEGYTLVEPQLN